jgi:hypothetical protein
MMDRIPLARSALQEIRRAGALQSLDEESRRTLEDGLARVESALAADDPYANLMATPNDLQRDLSGVGSSGRGDARGGKQAAPPPPPPAPPAASPPPPSTAEIGRRAAESLEAVNFPGFVASLITGTFRAIVDATLQQLQQYSELVASIAKSADDFSAQNVSENQVRDWLAQKHPADLFVQLPPPGTTTAPKLLPRPGKAGTSPEWLKDHDLEGEELTPELTDGALVASSRRHVGEDRLQTLATMVLLGINRIVVNEGDIRARLQFHAAARDTMTADMMTAGVAQQQAIGAQPVQSQTATTMMVSTLKANAQADASIKADLMGEVRVSFRSETFPLERFADSAAIQLINRHARWQQTPAPAANAPATPTPTAAPAPAATAPVPAPTQRGGTP